MISREQRELTEEIKQVHLWLRTRAQEVGVHKAWEEHLDRPSILERYAHCMKTLAETFWDSNNVGERLTYCRINWVVNTLKEYYFQDGFDKELSKERNKLNNREDARKAALFTKIKLLDVGSCYNPFSKFDIFDTTAIDLYPADASVVKCDFLSVTPEDATSVDTRLLETSHILPKNYFHAVVFSLFLEYLPSPEQRTTACVTARNVLRPGGLLLIITPDSKHESANSKLMKTWKYALYNIGFTRIKIQKLRYLYCMAFRKPLVPVKLADSRDVTFALHVPQDFVDYSKKANPDFSSIRDNDEEIAQCFSDLPMNG